MSISRRYLREIIEKFVAIILIIILLPVMLVISIFLIIDLREFPIFVQTRSLTLTSKPFKIYKYRTLKSHSKHNPNENIFFKTELKEFVPAFSSFLRKTGLDEILQLFNIVKGDMQFIGPRPLTLEDLKTIKKYNPDLYEKRSGIKMKPGITGYWQTFGNRNNGVEDLINSDLYYYKNASFKLGVKIMFMTIFIMLTGKHSDSIIIKTKKGNSSTLIDNGNIEFPSDN
jgi:undecaprenyl phosphate N,N'-diacetylbacillosamine 1-phosphate transferase